MRIFGSYQSMFDTGKNLLIGTLTVLQELADFWHKFSASISEQRKTAIWKFKAGNA